MDLKATTLIQRIRKRNVCPSKRFRKYNESFKALSFCVTIIAFGTHDINVVLQEFNSDEHMIICNHIAIHCTICDTLSKDVSITTFYRTWRYWIGNMILTGSIWCFVSYFSIKCPYYCVQLMNTKRSSDYIRKSFNDGTIWTDIKRLFFLCVLC